MTPLPKLDISLVPWLEKTYSRDLYLPELQMLVDYGHRVDVRGRETLELLNFTSVVREPWHHCILIPSRRWNPWLALSEALWILAGRNDVAALKPYNSHISDFSDDGVHLYGAYGARIYDQIDPLIERLRKDPSDRRAVLQIWDQANGDDPYVEPFNDLTVESKDPPCNNLVYFKLRQNKLHMTVICRSNDIHWGLFAVNLPTFGILQSYIAARLGVEMGTQTHLSNSLHVYTDDKRAADITDRMLYKESEDLPVYPEHELVFRTKQFSRDSVLGITHKDYAEMCSSALDDLAGAVRAISPSFLLFAQDFLRQYREHEWHPEDLAFNEEWPDWIMAGQMFLEQVWKR